MQLPTKNEIVDRRIDHFKKQLDEVRHTEKLNFFRELVQAYQTENELDMEDVAAALAYLVQKEQPLQPQIADEPTRPQRDRKDRNERGDKSGRGEFKSDDRDPPRRRDRGREESQEPPVDLDMRRYRIEVGKEHGVQPKNIVGAIANEISLDSEYIGNIRIRDSHTVLDLPDGMPMDVFEHLKSVRVCGRKLEISVDRGEGEGSAASDRRPSRGGKPGGRPAPSRGGKPGDRPPPRSRSQSSGAPGKSARADRKQSTFKPKSASGQPHAGGAGGKKPPRKQS